MKILKIIEGIDRINKSTSINTLCDYYEKNNLKVLVLHEKKTDLPRLMIDSEHEHLRKTITDFHEKDIFSLSAYAYFIRFLFKQYDVILADRLHLTTRVYADINRPGSIQRVFGSYDNHITYMHTFENQLKRIPNIDIELLLFTKSDGSKYEDDYLDSRWPQTAEAQKKINTEFVKLIKKTTLKHKHFICKEDTNGYYNTLTQLKKHLQIDVQRTKN